MGLAPQWVDKPMTASERRWVSACILARTNRFGKRVRISMRADRPEIPALTSTAAERASHPHHEGGFYGDIFAPEPVAFVCVDPQKTLQRREAERALARVCSHSYGSSDAVPRLSACGFQVVEGCDRDEVWPETIHVYLP